MNGESLIGRLRRPEYTGDRRCWPCTVVNGIVLIAVATGLWWVASPVAGLGVGAVGAAVVWLRGYLVPGTPAFAPRLVAAVPGGEALFEKRGDTGSGSVERGDRPGSLATESIDPDGEALLEELIAAGVVEPDGEALALDAGFEAEWFERMSALSSLRTEDLAAAAGEVSPASAFRTVRDDETTEEWIALGGGADGDGDSAAETLAEVWLSRPVAIAETAAVRALDGTVSDPATRRAAAGSLRMFLETCPDCGTPLEEGSAVSCCGGYRGERTVPEETLVCPACRARLFTFR